MFYKPDLHSVMHLLHDVYIIALSVILEVMENML